MLALVIVLSVFIFLFLLMIGFIIVRLITDNNELKKDNEDLQKRLDDLIKKPSMVGLSYKSDKKDVQAIMDSMKTVLVDMQKASCKVAQKDIDEYRRIFMENAAQELAQASSPIKCSDVRTMHSQTIDDFVDMFLADVPKENAGAVRESLKGLVVAILDAHCENDSVDLKKLEQLFKDVFDAICTNV